MDYVFGVVLDQRAKCASIAAEVFCPENCRVIPSQGGDVFGTAQSEFRFDLFETTLHSQFAGNPPQVDMDGRQNQIWESQSQKPQIEARTVERDDHRILLQASWEVLQVFSIDVHVVLSTV